MPPISNTAAFVEKANRKHGYKYQYNNVDYKNARTKVFITCPIHGDFLQKPNDHLTGYGCSECGGVKKLTTESFIIKAKQIHKNTYTYDNVDYKTDRIKISITCPVHGDFYQRPDTHLAGSGCPACVGLQPLTTDMFIKRSNIKHNFVYSYSKAEYKNSRTKICIICPIHGEFWQTPNSHLCGRGCSNCNSTYKQHRWLDILGIPNDSNHREVVLKIGKKLPRVDGYDPITKTVYEFNGDEWHGNPATRLPTGINRKLKITYGELHLKTIQRQKLLESAGYTVISIWESDFDKIYPVEELPEGADINWLDPAKVTPPVYSKKVEKVLK